MSVDPEGRIPVSATVPVPIEAVDPAATTGEPAELVEPGAVVSSADLPHVGEPVEPEEARIAREAREARVAAWAGPFKAALSVSGVIVQEYGARVEASADTDPEYDDEGTLIDSGKDPLLGDLQPSTAVVVVQKNKVDFKEPKALPGALLRRFWSYAGERPVMFGWTVAENTVSSTAKPITRETGGELGDVLAEVGADDIASHTKEADVANEGDVEYDPNAIVERVIVTSGKTNPLVLLKGPAGELDKAYQDGNQDAMTRIASIRVEKGKGEKAQASADSEKAKLGEYVKRNGFAQVEVSVITPEKIAEGKLDLEDPVAMGEMVRNGLRALIGAVAASRADRQGPAAKATN